LNCDLLTEHPISTYSSLKKNYDDKVAKELLLISQWKGKADNINKWLDNMEEHLNNLQLAGENPSSVRNEFEVITNYTNYTNEYYDILR